MTARSGAARLLRRATAAVVVVVVSAACAGEPSFDTVQDLFAAAGGEAWCDDELVVTMEPFVGTCGDPASDSRVILGVGGGGAELRASIDRARDNLAEDAQLLLVPSDPDAAFGWQLRSRDRSLLEAAQVEVGGVLLDDLAAVDAWLGD